MAKKAYDHMNWPRIEAVVYAEEQSPRDVMGPKITKDGVILQGFFPEALSAEVISGGKTYEMDRQDDQGYFAILLPEHKIPAYTFRVNWSDRTETFADAYAFPCQITEAEEKAFLAGVWYDSYKKLGAHPMEISGVKGTYFAVWAPNAMRVSIVGGFNNWDGRRLPMHRMPMTGIYELFVPEVLSGSLYKYEMLLKGGILQLKADPYAMASEVPQGDASKVADEGDFDFTDGEGTNKNGSKGFAFTDDEWIKKRGSAESFNVPISIGEVSLADWDDPEKLAAFIKEENYTHVELHPVMEYLTDGADGYPSSSLYAVSARYGGAAALKKLINELHRSGIGVILDWNAAQFPKYATGLSLFDGTPLYEPSDPKAQIHPMWDTMLYNYGSPMVTEYLLSNACFWAEEFHADGLRLDDVDAMLYLDYGKQPGEYTPNIYGTNENLQAIEFLKHFNSIMHKKYPGFLTIAHEDGLWPCLTGSVEDDFIGFDYKWSGGWTGDLLSYLETDPIMRSGRHDQLTLSMLYAYSEHYVLTLGSRDVGNQNGFLAKVWGDEAQKMAQVREAYAYMYMHPGCKMTALSGDASPEIRKMIGDLNRLYREYPALSVKDDDYEGFEWIQLMKYDENVITFMRKSDKPEETLLVICNFAAVPYAAYQVGVPFYGKYKEIFNSDDAAYGGSGNTNLRARTALIKECDERDYSIKVKVPALSVCVFTCTPVEPPVKKEKVSEKGVKSGKKAVTKKTEKSVKKADAEKAAKSVKKADAEKTTKSSGKKATAAAEAVKARL